jgi:hypothetical protein
VPGDPLAANLHRFLIYTLLTSTGSFDTGRAITNAVAIVLLGPAVLTTLRRAARRVTVLGRVTGPPGPDGPDRPDETLPVPADGPSVGADVSENQRKEAPMSAPFTGLRDEAGSQI